MNGEKMVRGLADFIEGTDEPDDDSADATTGHTSAEDQSTSPRMSAVMRKQSENAQKVLDDLDEITCSPGRDGSAKCPASSARPSAKEARLRTSQDDPSRILGRAAKIIRHSTEADGVIFLNTSTRNFQGLGRRGSKGDGTDLSSAVNSGSDISNDSVLQSRQVRIDSADSGEDVRPLKSVEKPRRTLCEVVGLSISQNEQYGRLEANDFGFPEENMEKYIKKFPYGKFFSFTDSGSGISSGDEVSEKPSESNAACDRRPSNPRPEKERFLPTELLKVLPGIRSLIFLPLWDFTEGKYIAGGFIWTSTAGRLMSPENELPYLKAFGNSIMSEISRVKATKSDRAKATFIASISHELRSPLHGILGSVEFLHETNMSTYQGQLFSSIETCGRTLLDTIDHVLDYSKINKRPAKRRAYSRTGSKRDQVESIVGLTTVFDLATLVEEVVDAVSVGHVFRRSHKRISPDQDAYGLALTGVAPLESSSSAGSTSQLEPVVILDIKPRRNWFVRTQPGALRRVVMNLIGNSLKYTTSGSISVSLQVESETDRDLKIRLRVADTGKGMSVEFQRTRLFSPFSQEDPFATGTGLGLSIIQQIVQALQGTITLSSTQFVGTDVEVVLTLPVAAPPRESQPLEPPISWTQDTKIRIMNPSELALDTRNHPQGPELTALLRLREVLRDTCEGWFGMNLIETSDQGTPDMILLPMSSFSAEELLRYCQRVSGSSPVPVIALCSNTSHASEFRTNVASQLAVKGIQAVPVTQPLGPRKLAAVMEKLRDDQVRHKQRIVLGRKESDPEAARRERDNLREALRAEDEKANKHPESSPLSMKKTKATVPRRPGPSLLANVEAVSDQAQSVPATIALTHENPTLGRITTQYSQRSMSAPPAGLKSSGSAAISHLPKSGLRVLLVDDNDINLQLLVMFMKKQGLPYETASNGLLALEAYEAAFVPPSPHLGSSRRSGASASTDALGSTLAARYLSKTHPPFTHVLMDLSMPVMDGLTSTREIRAFEVRNSIDPPSTIIALTGLASAEAQEDALSAGITEFLIKPVKFGELKGLLKSPRG